MERYGHIGSQLWMYLLKNTKEAEFSFVSLGILIVFGYAGWYLLWHFTTPHAYENLGLRISASMLGFPLIFHRYLPVKLKLLFPIYWYSTLIYIFPFFFSFMLFNNNGSIIWQLNAFSPLLLLILLTDWLSMIVIMIIGSLLGWAVYVITNISPHFPDNLTGMLVNYLALILFCALFLSKRSKFQNEKLQTMRALGMLIAHEMRVPLRAIQSGIHGLSKRLPSLVSGYGSAKSAKLDIPHLSRSDVDSFSTVFRNVNSETIAAFSVIDMLLIKADLEGVDKSKFERCSVKSCIDKVMVRYPFKSGEKNLVHIGNDNFEFCGNALLIEHVLFNLLKNSLYYIKEAGKGKIYITFDSDRRHNKLNFKDTGKGISEHVLLNIFDQFYTKTPGGAGVGLFFCKSVMQNMGGDICCSSTEGEFVCFSLLFPKK